MTKTLLTPSFTAPHSAIPHFTTQNPAILTKSSLDVFIIQLLFLSLTALCAAVFSYYFFEEPDESEQNSFNAGIEVNEKFTSEIECIDVICDNDETIERIQDPEEEDLNLEIESASGADISEGEAIAMVYIDEEVCKSQQQEEFEPASNALQLIPYNTQKRHFDSLSTTTRQPITQLKPLSTVIQPTDRQSTMSTKVIFAEPLCEYQEPFKITRHSRAFPHNENIATTIKPILKGYTQSDLNSPFEIHFEILRILGTIDGQNYTLSKNARSWAGLILKLQHNSGKYLEGLQLFREMLVPRIKQMVKDLNEKVFTLQNAHEYKKFMGSTEKHREYNHNMLFLFKLTCNSADEGVTASRSAIIQACNLLLEAPPNVSGFKIDDIRVPTVNDTLCEPRAQLVKGLVLNIHPQLGLYRNSKQTTADIDCGDQELDYLLYVAREVQHFQTYVQPAISGLKNGADSCIQQLLVRQNSFDTFEQLLKSHTKLAQQNLRKYRNILAKALKNVRKASDEADKRTIDHVLHII